MDQIREIDRLVARDRFGDFVLDWPMGTARERITRDLRASGGSGRVSVRVETLVVDAETGALIG